MADIGETIIRPQPLYVIPHWQNHGTVKDSQVLLRGNQVPTDAFCSVKNYIKHYADGLMEEGNPIWTLHGLKSESFRKGGRDQSYIMPDGQILIPVPVMKEKRDRNGFVSLFDVYGQCFTKDGKLVLCFKPQPGQVLEHCIILPVEESADALRRRVLDARHYFRPDSDPRAYKEFYDIRDIELDIGGAGGHEKMTISTIGVGILGALRSHVPAVMQEWLDTNIAKWEEMGIPDIQKAGLIVDQLAGAFSDFSFPDKQEEEKKYWAGFTPQERELSDDIIWRIQKRVSQLLHPPGPIRQLSVDSHQECLLAERYIMNPYACMSPAMEGFALSCDILRLPGIMIRDSKERAFLLSPGKQMLMYTLVPLHRTYGPIKELPTVGYRPTRAGVQAMIAGNPALVKDFKAGRYDPVYNPRLMKAILSSDWGPGRPEKTWKPQPLPPLPAEKNPA